MRSVYRFLLLAGAVLLPPGAASAQMGYTIQTLLQGGDRAGSFVACDCGGSNIGVVGINDAGQASFFAQDDANKLALLLAGPGGLAPVIKINDRLGDYRFEGLVNNDAVGPDQEGRITFVARDGGSNTWLLQWAAGQLSVIAATGTAAPGGAWKSVFFDPGDPLSVNVHGDVAFNGVVDTWLTIATPRPPPHPNVASTAAVPAAWTETSGTFLWNAQKQQVSFLNLQGSSLDGGLTVSGTLPYNGALINNGDEVVVDGYGKDSAGEDWQGLLLLGRDQKPHLIAREGQALPGGGTLGSIASVAFNDQDTVAFTAIVGGKAAVYQWANGTLNPTGIAEGAAAPGGGTVAYVDSVWLNNLNSNLLIAARLNDSNNGPGGYYLFGSGQLKPIAAPGQQMPDGVVTPGFLGSAQVSRPNTAGELAFITGFPGSSAAYRLKPDGRVSLIARSGIDTGIGSLDQVGSASGYPIGIALNDKGQVVLRALVDQHDTVLLLTPASP